MSSSNAVNWTSPTSFVLKVHDEKNSANTVANEPKIKIKINNRLNTKRYFLKGMRVSHPPSISPSCSAKHIVSRKFYLKSDGIIIDEFYKKMQSNIDNVDRNYSFII